MPEEQGQIIRLNCSRRNTCRVFLEEFRKPDKIIPDHDIIVEGGRAYCAHSGLFCYTAAEVAEGELNEPFVPVEESSCKYF